MPEVNAEHHIARIRALDAAWLVAAANRDLDGMMAIYSSDAWELLPDLPAVVGEEAIRRFYGELLARFPRFTHHFEPQDVIVAAAGDLAVVRGAYRFTPDTLIPHQVFTGKFVGVWRHLDGDWRLVLNISNGDTPAHPSGSRAAS